MLEVWDSWIEPVQICVERKVGEALPRRLVRLDLDGVHAERRVVAHRWRRDHRDAVEAAVAEFTTVL